MTGFFLFITNFISFLISVNVLLAVLFESQRWAAKQLHKLIKYIRHHWRNKK